MQDYRRLKVWQQAHALVLMVYARTADFPKHEVYGLTSQLRRAAASVPTNIVEGCGRGTDRDQLRFFQIAMGSIYETEYLLLLSCDLGYLDANGHAELLRPLGEVMAMQRALIKRLQTRINVQ